MIALINFSRLAKNAHLRRSPRPSSLQRTCQYASLLRTSGALHLGIFDQTEKTVFQQTVEYEGGQNEDQSCCGKGDVRSV